MTANAEETPMKTVTFAQIDAIPDMIAALKLARRSMIVSVTGISDGLTIHDIRQWIEIADAALAKAGEQP